MYGFITASRDSGTAAGPRWRELPFALEKWHCGCKHEMSQDVGVVWSPESHPGILLLAHAWSTGFGDTAIPRRAGAGSLCSIPRQSSCTLSFVTAPLAAAEDDVLACPSVPQTVYHSPTHSPGTITATLCPALCTLVTQAMGTGSSLLSDTKGGTCVCESKRDQSLWQSTPRLLPLPHSTGGTQGVTALSDSHHQAQQCGQLSSMPPSCRPSHR